MPSPNDIPAPFVSSDDPSVPIAFIVVADGTGVQDVALADDVRVSLDADGRMLGVEIDDKFRFGDPFDQAAAERLVSWAREQLAARVSR
jgi:hypothetical protein